MRHRIMTDAPSRRAPGFRKFLPWFTGLCVSSFEHRARSEAAHENAQRHRQLLVTVGDEPAKHPP
jgi:hypothetical protein